MRLSKSLLPKSLLLIILLSVGVLRADAADSGIFSRSGFTSLTPTANQTWVFNQLDNRLYAYDNLGNWQQQTLGRIQSAGIGAPTSSNDSTQNYSIGSLWFDTIGQQWYVCTSNTATAATWSIFTGRVAQTDINNSIQPKLTLADAGSDFVAYGLLGTVPASSLTMTTPTGVAYVSGLRVTPSANTFTFTASKDTYCYLQTNGSINYVPVANGAGAPVGQTGLLIQKVVTGSSAITSVTQIATTAPVFNVGTATPSTNNAIPITQADSRYVQVGTVNGPFSAGYVMASPATTSGALSPRALVSTDLPIVALAQGGLGNSTSATINGILVGNGSGYSQIIAPNTPLSYLRWNASGTAFEYAVSAGIASLTLADSSGIYTYSGPLTSSGTITGTLATQAAQTVLAGSAVVNGSTATPSFRKLGRLDVFGDYSGLRPLPCATPAAPTSITHGGTAGSTSYTYSVAAVMADGITITAAGPTLATATGNATLSGTNTNVISWAAVTGAAKYNVYRTASSGSPSTTGLIGTTASTSFTDTGIAGTTAAPTTTTMIGDYFQGVTSWTQPGPITANYVRIYAASTLTFNNTFTCATECMGGQAPTATETSYIIGGSNGAGLGGGQGCNALTYPTDGSQGYFGGGGGHGGIGGSGAGTGVPNGGGTYPLSVCLSGSGGAAGASSSTSTGGNGGAGGGSLYIEDVGNIVFTSGCTLTANGGNGIAGTGTTGGGGSGGGIEARSLGTVTISSGATITANGGTGTGGGGGGIIEISSSNTTYSGATVTANGGTGGTQNGFAGIVNLYSFIQGQRSP